MRVVTLETGPLDNYESAKLYAKNHPYSIVEAHSRKRVQYVCDSKWLFMRAEEHCEEPQHKYWTIIQEF